MFFVIYQEYQRGPWRVWKDLFPARDVAETFIARNTWGDCNPRCCYTVIEAKDPGTPQTREYFK